jgi:predicted dehydrogenase
MLKSRLSLDLVVILTADQYHAEHVIQCADEGKHVLIEKPMAQTFVEAEAIEEARKRNDVVIFVGYMRRFAPALDLLKAEIEGKQIRYVRVRDIIGKASVHEADPLCLP